MTKRSKPEKQKKHKEEPKDKFQKTPETIQKVLETAGITYNTPADEYDRDSPTTGFPGPARPSGPSTSGFLGSSAMTLPDPSSPNLSGSSLSGLPVPRLFGLRDSASAHSSALSSASYTNAGYVPGSSEDSPSLKEAYSLGDTSSLPSNLNREPASSPIRRSMDPRLPQEKVDTSSTGSRSIDMVPESPVLRDAQRGPPSEEACDRSGSWRSTDLLLAPESRNQNFTNNRGREDPVIRKKNRDCWKGNATPESTIGTADETYLTSSLTSISVDNPVPVGGGLSSSSSGLPEPTGLPVDPRQAEMNSFPMIDDEESDSIAPLGALTVSVPPVNALLPSPVPSPGSLLSPHQQQGRTTPGLENLRAMSSRNSRSTVTSESFANPLYESSEDTSLKDTSPEFTSPEVEEKPLPKVDDSQKPTTERERVSGFGEFGDADDLLSRGMSLDEEDVRAESVNSRNAMKFNKKLISLDSGDLLSARTPDVQSPEEPEASPQLIDATDTRPEHPVTEASSTDAQNPSDSPKTSKPEDPVVLNYFHVEETFDMSAWTVKYMSEPIHQNPISSLEDEIDRLEKFLTPDSLLEKYQVPLSEDELQLFEKSPTLVPLSLEEIELLEKDCLRSLSKDELQLFEKPSTQDSLDLSEIEIETVGRVIRAADMSDLFSGITDSIKSTASAITRNEYVRKVAESMNDAIMNYPKAEMAVREATNEDPWGPTGPQMKKIAEYTKSRYSEDYYNVFNPLFSRMLENNKDAWRRVYKSLVLLDYLVKNGSERFVSEARDKVFELRRLESYKYTDEKGKDQGINIRHRVKLILEMLNDDDKLAGERSKATSDDKSKYRGYDQYDIKMSSSSSSSSNYNKKWESSSSSNNFGDTKRDREVSNFSFSSNSNANNRSPSPELGFVDEGKKRVEEDDGFGDFVSSRSSQPAATNKSTPNPTKPKSFFDAVPAIPPPSSTSNYVAPPLSPVEKKGPSNFDLLGGFDDPTPVPAPTAQSNSFDLFSLSTPVIAAPVVAPAASTPSADLFDFGPAPVTQSTMAPAAPSNGGFNGFDFGAAFGASPSLGGATPLQPATGHVQPAQPKPFDLGGGPTPKVGNSFAGLDQFMNLSLNSNTSTQKPKTLNQMMGGGN